MEIVDYSMHVNEARTSVRMSFETVTNLKNRGTNLTDTILRTFLPKYSDNLAHFIGMGTIF